MGIIGWGTLVDQINSETGGAYGLAGDVSSGVPTGRGIGGLGIVNTYSGAPPAPPVILGFILLETGLENFLLQESGLPPTRIELE
jgi:hypothetical protein